MQLINIGILYKGVGGTRDTRKSGMAIQYFLNCGGCKIS